MTRLAVTVSLVLVALLVCACDGSNPQHQRLESIAGPTNFREVCLPFDRGPRFTVGVADAENTGDRPVTVTSAELTKTQGINADRIDLIVLRRGSALGEFGLWRGSPPKLPPAGAATHLWRSRVPAVGASLPTKPARLNFVIGLTAEKNGSAGPLIVTYEDADGNTGTWTSNVTYTIGDPCG